MEPGRSRRRTTPSASIPAVAIGLAGALFLTGEFAAGQLTTRVAGAAIVLLVATAIAGFAALSPSGAIRAVAYWSAATAVLVVGVLGGPSLFGLPVVLSGLFVATAGMIALDGTPRAGRAYLVGVFIAVVEGILVGGAILTIPA